MEKLSETNIEQKFDKLVEENLNNKMEETDLVKKFDELNPNDSNENKDDKIKFEKELEELIVKSFNDNIEIKEKTITNLTEPGENYFSNLLKVDMVVLNKETNKEEPLNVVVKRALNDGFLAKPSQLFFKSEIAFYTEVLPTIQNFLKEKGVPEMTCFAKYIAGRLNLCNGPEPDGNAMIILENLVAKGYKNLDRHEGFDLQGAKMVLIDIAKLHAVPIAIKLQKPDIFEKKIVKNVLTHPEESISFNDEKEDKRPPLFPFHIIKQFLRSDVLCRKYVDKFQEFVDYEKKLFDAGKFPDTTDPTVFSTLVHNDMWVNNTMQKVSDGNVIENMLIDFQGHNIGNPASDLLFFLVSSVQLPVLENYFDYLLNFYHEKFIQTLEACGCDIKPFSHNNFQENLKRGARLKFIHSIIMNCCVIYGKKGQHMDFKESETLTLEDIHSMAKEKVKLFFREIIKRNWFL